MIAVSPLFERWIRISVFLGLQESFSVSQCLRGQLNYR
jgi:hypothetical protein